MHILVTGGAGFIGSHVVDELLRGGQAVRVMDDLGPPSHDGTMPAYLDRRAEFMRGDVRVKDDWRRALAGMDAVIHLAAYMDYHLDFSAYVRTNIESVTTLFEVIVEDKLPIKKIVAASSQSVYGEGKYRCPVHGDFYARPRAFDQLERHDWDQHCPGCDGLVEPLPEMETDELRPEIPYGISKWAAERLLENLGRQLNVPIVSLRYSIVLGPRQSVKHFYSGALRAFAVNALNREPMHMNEDGRQLRDFVHVQDVARAHLAVLTDPRADFQAFNVGSGVGTRVEDLAKLVAEEVGRPFDPLLSNRFRVGGARHSLMDISRLKSLGWSPQHSLRDMVRDYLAYVKQFNDLADILKQTDEKMKREGLLKEL